MSALIILILVCIIVIFFVRQRIKAKENIENSLENQYTGLKIVSFLIPLVGLIVYAVNIVQNPKVAKACGKWALMGFIVGIAIMVTIFVIQFA